RRSDALAPDGVRAPPPRARRPRRALEGCALPPDGLRDPQHGLRLPRGQPPALAEQPQRLLAAVVARVHSAARVPRRRGRRRARGGGGRAPLQARRAQALARGARPGGPGAGAELAARRGPRGRSRGRGGPRQRQRRRAGLPPGQGHAGAGGRDAAVVRPFPGPRGAPRCRGRAAQGRADWAGAVRQACAEKPHLGRGGAAVAVRYREV
ncbi:unnamed protein product, partial [Prorocentrum cordatum]